MLDAGEGWETGGWKSPGEASVGLRSLRLELALVSHESILSDGAVVGTGMCFGTVRDA